MKKIFFITEETIHVMQGFILWLDMYDLFPTKV